MVNVLKLVEEQRLLMKNALVPAMLTSLDNTLITRWLDTCETLFSQTKFTRIKECFVIRVKNTSTRFANEVDISCKRVDIGTDEYTD